MKRILLLTILILTISGCTKIDNALVGTKWETSGFTLIDLMVGWKYHIYEFIDGNNVDAYWLDRNGKVASFEGTFKYTIEEPYVIIEHDSDDIRKLEIIDKMTMVITTNTSIKYFKQP